MKCRFHISLFGAAASCLLMLASCQTKTISEAQRFEASVRKEMPFKVDSLRLIDGTDIATFQFDNHFYIPTLPDAEISSDGELNVYKTLLFEKPSLQTEDVIWRNVVVSKKNLRTICIDRILRKGMTHGYVYVLQSESKKYPTFGKYH